MDSDDISSCWGAMKKILSGRMAIWIVFTIYMLNSWYTWQVYEARGMYPPTILDILGFALLVIFLVVCVYRCKSLNWSGWRVAALMIPIVGFFLLLFLLTKRPLDETDTNYHRRHGDSSD